MLKAQLDRYKEPTEFQQEALKNDVDALVTMEMVDFTTCEYVRDAGMLGQSKCAITIGHFNLEEPGMEYMVRWLPAALGTDQIPATFVPMTDTYQYVVRG